jgi:hypothetical protein
MAQTPLEYTNGAATTLDGGIAVGTTQVIVADGSVFPDAGEFLVSIFDKATYPDPNDDAAREIILCTGRTGNTLTVTRAQESTSAVTHATGEAAELRLTAGGLNRLWDAAAEMVLLAPGSTADNILQATAATVTPLTLQAHAAQTADLLSIVTSASAALIAVSAAGDVTLAGGVDVALDSTTGSKLGTGSTQRLGFWGATPTQRPASADQAAVAMNITDGEFTALTIPDTYSTGEFVTFRGKCEELADDVRAHETLLNSLRSALVNAGIIKGSA